ncbi:hypothetical protein C1H46_022831 [Malus baccata]|uniref:Uncharacterized protein n=1 Tax=Malus baccata TaxID=106549 RepID=A0A540LZ89_MALBA|nr:hypothetical protein C1H46_022831 [Malus baccata]
MAEETVAQDEEYLYTGKPIKTMPMPESSRVEQRVEEPSPEREQIMNNWPHNQNNWNELSAPLYSY